MGKHSTVSGILVVIVVLMIAASTFMLISYATGVLSAAVAYASTDQIAKLQACGAAPPAELVKFRDDIPTLLLPAMYVGFPGLMVILAILMFIAGYYYGNGKEGRTSSETIITTRSPNRKNGKYASGRRVEETRTQKSSKTEGN